LSSCACADRAEGADLGRTPRSQAQAASGPPPQGSAAPQAGSPCPPAPPFQNFLPSLSVILRGLEK